MCIYIYIWIIGASNLLNQDTTVLYDLFCSLISRRVSRDIESSIFFQQKDIRGIFLADSDGRITYARPREGFFEGRSKYLSFFLPPFPILRIVQLSLRYNFQEINRYIFSVAGNNSGYFPKFSGSAFDRGPRSHRGHEGNLEKQATTWI